MLCYHLSLVATTGATTTSSATCHMRKVAPIRVVLHEDLQRPWECYFLSNQRARVRDQEIASSTLAGRTHSVRLPANTELTTLQMSRKQYLPY
jgi:hypothetical protein